MNYYLKISILVFFTFIISSIRFNRNDYIIKNDDQLYLKNSKIDPPDSKRYTDIIEYFRHQKDAKELVAPFTYRPLIPFAASFLPFSSMTSLNIINLIFTYLTLFYLFKILKIITSNSNIILIGLYLYIVSFPVFYYTTIGYLDPALMFCLMACTFYLISGKLIPLYLIFTVSIFIKESIIILLPLSAIYWLWKKEFIYKKSFLLLFLLLIIYFAGSYISRNIITNTTNIYWNPSFTTFFYNLLRVKTYLSFALTFGLPGLISLFYIYKNNFKLEPSKDLYLLFLSGFTISLLLFIYSLFSAYADGRFIWPSYVFTVPLSIMFLDKYYPKIIKSKNKIEPVVSEVNNPKV